MPSQLPEPGGIVAVVVAEASVEVIPGPVTLAERALLGERWCPCHGWHHRPPELACPEERSA